MKTRFMILGIAVLIVFGLTNGTFAQNKPHKKTKTTIKTENVMKNNTKQVKTLNHKAAMQTVISQDIKNSRMKNEKIILSQNMTKAGAKERIH